MRKLKQYIKEVLENLEEVSLSGSVGGVSTRLGTGPRGKTIYKSKDSTDEEYRDDDRENSVQNVLKKN